MGRLSSKSLKFNDLHGRTLEKCFQMSLYFTDLPGRIQRNVSKEVLWNCIQVSSESCCYIIEVRCLSFGVVANECNVLNVSKGSRCSKLPFSPEEYASFRGKPRPEGMASRSLFPGKLSDVPLHGGLGEMRLKRCPARPCFTGSLAILLVPHLY